MSNEKQVDSSRRGLLVATCAAGGVAGLATAGAFVSTFQPSERAKAAGAPVEVDISTLAPGDMKTVEWRGKPVWILKRTPEMLETLKKVDAQVADPQSKRTEFSTTPEYALNEWRSIKKDLLVVVGICPHLGCSPSSRPARNRRCRTTGRVASFVHVTVRRSTWRAGSTKTSRPQTTSRFHGTCLKVTRNWSSAKMRKARRNHGCIPRKTIAQRRTCIRKSIELG